MGNRRVHQDTIAPQLHGNRRIGSSSYTGIDDDRHLGVIDNQAQIPRIQDAHAGTDQRGERHHRDATNIFEHPGLDRVVRAVDHDMEAIFDQRFRRLQGFRHIGKQAGRIAQNFQLAQRVAVQQLARQFPKGRSQLQLPPAEPRRKDNRR